MNTRGLENLHEDDMLDLARKVLTGKLKRDQLLTNRNALVGYAGITMMLALRYKLSPDNKVEGDFDSALRDLVLRGKVICSLKGRLVTSGDLRDLTRMMGLTRREPGEPHLTIVPPLKLQRLIERHAGHPAVAAFKEDMEAGIAYHEAWLRRLLKEVDLQA